MTTVKRSTWQKEAIRTALDETPEFVSAQQLHAGLAQQGVTIGLATVYRSLTDLAESGQADTQVLDGETLYRSCSTEEHHHHLTCRRCGATVELEAAPIEAWAAEVAAAHGYVEVDHVVDVFGVCPDCAARR